MVSRRFAVGGSPCNPLRHAACTANCPMELQHTGRVVSNAKMPEAPAEVLEVPHGILSRTRESDAGKLAHAISASSEHLRPWISWATEEVAGVQAQRRLCRQAEARWEDGSGYRYLLRPGPSEQVIGGFNVWR